MSQPRLVFSNNTLPFSPPPKTSRSDSRTPSRRKALRCPFLDTMIELKRVSPAHASVLEKLAKQMIARTLADVSTNEP